MRGINVCLNDGNTRIKGMRIYGTKLDRATGTLTNLSGCQEWKRPNCNGNWKTIRSCPAGKVARGIKIDAKEGSRADPIIGVRLLCRSVVPK